MPKSTSTVQSILPNEKYAGGALLQKSFTTDFLTKTTKVNETDTTNSRPSNGTSPSRLMPCATAEHSHRSPRLPRRHPATPRILRLGLEHPRRPRHRQYWRHDRHPVQNLAPSDLRRGSASLSLGEATIAFTPARESSPANQGKQLPSGQIVSVLHSAPRIKMSVSVTRREPLGAQGLSRIRGQTVQEADCPY